VIPSYHPRPVRRRPFVHERSPVSSVNRPVVPFRTVGLALLPGLAVCLIWRRPRRAESSVSLVNEKKTSFRPSGQQKSLARTRIGLL